MPPKKTPAPTGTATPSLVFAIVAGLFFFITIIKFGSPVVMDRYIDVPQDLASGINGLWPPHWAVWLFVPVALAGLFAVELRGRKFHWALLLPLVWLGWEFVSAGNT